MYIVTTKDGTTEYETWNDVPNVKISSLILLSPDKKNDIKLEGFIKYICMKEALATVGGFKLMANICYAVFNKISIKYRITNDNVEATLINTNDVINNLISDSLIRAGEDQDFVI